MAGLSSEFASPWDPIGMQSRHAVPFYVQSQSNSTQICQKNSIFRTKADSPSVDPLFDISRGESAHNFAPRFCAEMWKKIGGVESALSLHRRERKTDILEEKVAAP